MALHPVRRLNQIALKRRSLFVDTAYFLHFFHRIIRLFGQFDHIARQVLISLTERYMHPHTGQHFPEQFLRNDILKCLIDFLMRDFDDNISITPVFYCIFIHTDISSTSVLH